MSIVDSKIDLGLHTGQDQLQDRIDMYFREKQPMDDFFEQVWRVARELNYNTVVNSYLQSSIKNKFLRDNFEGGELKRASMLEKRPQVHAKRVHMKDEMQVIGDYIRNELLAEENRIKQIYEGVLPSHQVAVSTAYTEVNKFIR